MERFGIHKTVDLLAEAGFDTIDFSFPDEGYRLLSMEKVYYTELRKYAESKGVYFNQSHAPTPSSFCDEAESEKMFRDLVSVILRASYLGIKNIVVHPCQHLNYAQAGAPEQLFEYNMKFYRRLIPYCEEYGIRVAVENMWQYQGMVSHSTCSRPEEFIKYIDDLNSKFIVACLDLGHAMLVREQPDEFIRRLGNKRLKCMHVHDVDGTHDLHTLPFFGIIDWENIMKALAEIDYQGDLTFEADTFLLGKPDALIPQYLKVMEQTGRYLIGLFHEAQSLI